MKTQKIYKTILSAFIFLALVICAAGCSDSPLTTTKTKTYKALTERDFADKNLKAEPGAVIVLNLEDLHSPFDEEWFDTDIIGVDIIPISYTETAKHHFKIDEESGFEMSLINDSSKQVLFELTQQNKETDVMIPAGNYLLVITSLEDFKSDTLGSQVVFIQPDTETSGSGNTDYDPAQLNTLLSTRRCINCGLAEVRLINYNLSGMDLTGSYFYRANLTGADLTNTKLISTNFRNASLRTTFLRNTDFSNATVINTDLQNAVGNANFSGANLTSSYLMKGFFQDAKFNNADLTGANLTDADLMRAQLSNATLQGAKFINVQIAYVDFCGARFSGIIASQNRGRFSARCWPFNLN